MSKHWKTKTNIPHLHCFRTTAQTGLPKILGIPIDPFGKFSVKVCADTNGSIAGDDNAIGDDILTDDIAPDDVTGIAPEGALSGENSAGTTARNRGVSKGTAAAQTSRTSAAGESLFRVASFDQMIRNAKVHDEDGNLTDLENSITPGIMH